jgi:ribosomal protein S18 acetylase RimI-like enzyme
MHALDNPIWSALTTRQAALGRRIGSAGKFDAEVSLLGGFAEVDVAAMAELVPVGAQVGIFIDEPPTTSRFEVVASAPLLQMICRAPGSDGDVDPTPSIVKLGAADIPDMLALAELTKPGPFAPRTPLMGDFFGIRHDGRLVAMAGQRLRIPSHIEISGICTHPDHLGRGYGAALTRWQVHGILAAGEQPFLHVRGDNTRAIALYERLGFAPRLRSRYIVMRRVV